eukprot:797073-Amphidinium_carterae.1
MSAPMIPLEPVAAVQARNSNHSAKERVPSTNLAYQVIGMRLVAKADIGTVWKHSQRPLSPNVQLPRVNLRTSAEQCATA